MLSSFWRCKDKQKVQFLQKDWGVFFVFVYHCSMLLCLSIHLVAVKKSPLFVGSGQKGNPVNRYWKLPSGSVPESGWCHSPYKVSFLRICRKVVSRCSDALSGSVVWPWAVPKVRLPWGNVPRWVRVGISLCLFPIGWWGIPDAGNNGLLQDSHCLAVCVP